MYELMFMRVFVAISLPKKVGELIEELQKPLKSMGVFSCPQEAHLTLKFLGEITPELCKKVQDALGTIQFSSCTLSLDGLGVFSSLQHPRVLWVGLKPSKEIMILHSRIDEVLNPFFPEDVDFQPHLTIARVKRIINTVAFAKYVRTSVPPLVFRVSSFQLVESVLQPGKKPVYKTLSSFSSE